MKSPLAAGQRSAPVGRIAARAALVQDPRRGVAARKKRRRPEAGAKGRLKGLLLHHAQLDQHPRATTGRRLTAREALDAASADGG
jgi:hypothetical protein